jgi:hypothetical protein
MWSEHMAAVKPACSARTTAVSRSAGGTCSWEAWIRRRSTENPAPSRACYTSTLGLHLLDELLGDVCNFRCAPGCSAPAPGTTCPS